MPNNPNPLDPLTRYREIERAADALLEKLDMIFHDPEYLEVFSCAQNHRGPYRGDDVVDEMAALRPLLESTPNPDIALVPVRRIRKDGKPKCSFVKDCPFFQYGTFSGEYCTAVVCEKIPYIIDRNPHPDCPVWKEEGK